MNDIANYTFLPWLRQGIANQISGQAGVRATIAVELTLSGEKLDGAVEARPPIHKDIQIYGPGDIVGIDSKAIIKTEPQNWITNFEPNYLPCIEFYDEDFPWRYSPLRPANHRLLPWIMLLVLKESEFTDGKNIKDRPLAYIQLDAAAKLPPPEQLWAWAHIHINKSIIGENFRSEDANAIQSALGSLLQANPDMAYSRIVCPRKLEDNTPYHAFLVPVFESGRLAGLGQDPATAASYDTFAWTSSALPAEMPYYYRWYFRTGTIGDFEYLVRLLQPKPVDSRVGLRDMDVQKPGANIRGIVDAPEATDAQKLGGFLKLGGALRVPDIFYTPAEFAIIEKYRNWATLNNSQPYPHPFQSDLAAFINLTDSYEEKSVSQANMDSGIAEERPAENPDSEYDIKQNPDPLITAPLYGRWHALTQRLLKERDGSDSSPNDNWVNELNLDPRWRVAAGFGTHVVQDNQEDYMKSAWEQVGAVLEANKKIRAAQLALQVSWVWYQTHVKPIKEIQPEKWLALAAPMQKRILASGMTVYHQVNQSHVPRAAISAPMRKLTSPRGKLVKRIPFTATLTPNNVVVRINTGAVSAAPPRLTPDGLITLDDVAEQLKPKKLPGFVLDWLGKYAWLKRLPLALAAIILLLLVLLRPGALLLSICLAIAAGLVYLYFKLNNWKKQLDGANSVREENQTPASVDKLPKSANFRISRPEDNFRPSTGGDDNEAARRFKLALRDVHGVFQASAKLGAAPVKPALNIAAVGDVVFQQVHPDRTIPNWVWGSLVIPGRIREQLGEEFVEAMAYPEIDLPMYKPLADKAELFLPNINFIEQNSISLLETNQPFIESYMVGLNHEMARELLWREYPTDQRGSYFRQFWEARGFIDTEGLDPEALKEKLRDIPPLHLWSKFSHLGEHDNRESEGETEEEVVLVIRGELLKKYPDAVIYAHRAVWQDADGNRVWKAEDGRNFSMDDDGVITELPAGDLPIDLTKERDLRPLTSAEEANPPRFILKSPLYEAKVEPDIYFFGFDLTVCAAKGGSGTADEPVDERCAAEGITWEDPGWFFVIKERPGEPRFGLDIGGAESNIEGNKIEIWNDLAWSDLTPAVADGEYIQITGATPTITADQVLEGEDSEKEVQQTEDVHIVWSKDMSSAELAYILYQVPVLVAVHASEMLPRT